MGKIRFVLIGLVLGLSILVGAGTLVLSQRVSAAAVNPHIVVPSKYSAIEGVTSVVLIFPNDTEPVEDLAAIGEVAKQYNQQGKDVVVYACRDFSKSYDNPAAHDCVAIFYFQRPIPR